MASMTLDQDKQRFAEWRSQRQQRQPIPDGLWRVACNHISTLGISRVAREFRLNDTKLREKAVQAGIVLSRRGKRKTPRSKRVAFQELSLDRMFAPHGATLQQHRDANQHEYTISHGAILSGTANQHSARAQTAGLRTEN